MRRQVSIGIGVVVVLVGALWTLQGLDLLGGSGGMNGSTTWAVIGPITVLVGLAIAVAGARRPQRRP